MSAPDPLLVLLARFRDEGVGYVLVGGQAVRLNGYLRATEDVDVLLEATRENGERAIRALAFLPSSAELKPEWFVPGPDGIVENIRVADELLVDRAKARTRPGYFSTLCSVCWRLRVYGRTSAGQRPASTALAHAALVRTPGFAISTMQA